jgi:glycogen phosphorylase
MSQLAVGPRKIIERQNWTEITPQALYDKCLTLATNLWWSWHPEVVNLFRDLDPIKWRKIDHNPILMLAEMTPEQLAERAAEMVLYTRINQAHRRLKDYLSNTRATWGARENGRTGLAAGRLFFRRIRPARIGPDLFGRLGRALR